MKTVKYYGKYYEVEDWVNSIATDNGTKFGIRIWGYTHVPIIRDEGSIWEAVNKDASKYYIIATGSNRKINARKSLREV